MEEFKFKVGDKVRYKGFSSAYLVNGQITEITFCGNHKGNVKVMTPELDKSFPDKSGWSYQDDFEKVESDNYEIF